MARLVRATYTSAVPRGVARTSRAMTGEDHDGTATSIQKPHERHLPSDTRTATGISPSTEQTGKASPPRKAAA